MSVASSSPSVFPGQMRILPECVFTTAVAAHRGKTPKNPLGKGKTTATLGVIHRIIRFVVVVDFRVFIQDPGLEPIRYINQPELFNKVVEGAGLQ